MFPEINYLIKQPQFKKLSSDAKVIFTYLYWHSNIKDNEKLGIKALECCPSRNYLLEATGIRLESIGLAISELETEGLICVKKRHNKSNVYRITNLLGPRTLKSLTSQVHSRYLTDLSEFQRPDTNHINTLGITNSYSVPSYSSSDSDKDSDPYLTIYGSDPALNKTGLEKKKEDWELMMMILKTHKNEPDWLNKHPDIADRIDLLKKALDQDIRETIMKNVFE